MRIHPAVLLVVTNRSVPTISIELVERCHAAYNRGGQKTWADLVRATPEGVDLSQAVHRAAIHSYLNRWGCRLKKADGSAESAAAQALRDWWHDNSNELKALLSKNLAEVSDSEIERAAEVYWDLRMRKAGARRGIGPATAAKVLLALGPSTFPAWDLRIAKETYGGANRDAYRAHLAQCREWARQLEGNHASELGKLINPLERIGIAKLIDESLYGILTRKLKLEN